MGDNPGHLHWYRYRVWRPVRFSHGADGYIRGCYGSPRDLEIRQHSRWFEVVERCDETIHPPSYRPIEAPNA